MRFLASSSSLAEKDKIILDQARKKKQVIYGGQAIKSNIGIFARNTFDYDISTPHPRADARSTERALDRRSKGDNYYVHPSKHEGTYRVRFVGFDQKRGTPDDLNVADYSNARKMKTVMKNGIQYAALAESAKDKRKSVSDPTFKYRHEKDSEDLARISLFNGLRTNRRR
jgi:hypothetical protein